MTDLAELIIEEEAVTMQLRHPTTDELLTYKDKDGKEKPMTIDVVGTDSETYLKVERRLQDKMLREQKGLARGKLKTSVAKINADRLEKLRACITGWDLFFEGKLLEFTPKNVQMIVNSKGLCWIGEQVEEYCVERENFMSA